LDVSCTGFWPLKAAHFPAKSVHILAVRLS